jgi:hypothetical protein
MMTLKIQRVYFVPKLIAWLNEKKRNCHTCQLVNVPHLNHPSAALLPSKKCVVWQVDHIGKYPPDSKTGDRYFKNSLFLSY